MFWPSQWLADATGLSDWARNAENRGEEWAQWARRVVRVVVFVALLVPLLLLGIFVALVASLWRRR